ncbi:hypothetical protein ASB62_06395 [Chlorobium limicola]|uniref:Uncharacterized protein n=1 Tax=Chlorobium limicola TaxID=1092 RepID=A0A101JGZ5_CHLLI|nr:hypothetical protein ASB62_06395 [Chlorobium limicola]
MVRNDIKKAGKPARAIEQPLHAHTKNALPRSHSAESLNGKVRRKKQQELSAVIQLRLPPGHSLTGQQAGCCKPSAEFMHTGLKT